MRFNIAFPVLKRVLSLSMIAGGMVATSFADLNEDEFKSYSEGELLGQEGWTSQGPSELGKYTNQGDRAEVRFDAERGRKWLVWKAGFATIVQTRLLKNFNKTTGSKVVVKFGFLPGSTTVGGKMYFNESGKGGVAIRFSKGSLHVDSSNSEKTNTELAFSEDDWNNVELQFDFKAHQVTVFMNGKRSAALPLATDLTTLNQVNFFAGGESFESGLDDLSVQSVSEFTAPSVGQ